MVHDEPQVGVHRHGYQEAAFQYPLSANEGKKTTFSHLLQSQKGYKPEDSGQRNLRHKGEGLQAGNAAPHNQPSPFLLSMEGQATPERGFRGICAFSLATGTHVASAGAARGEKDGHTKGWKEQGETRRNAWEISERGEQPYRAGNSVGRDEAAPSGEGTSERPRSAHSPGGHAAPRPGLRVWKRISFPANLFCVLGAAQPFHRRSAGRAAFSAALI